MRPIKITFEQGIYLLVIVLAFTVRLAYLGSASLSDAESLLALKVLDFLGRTPSNLGGEPGYALITGLLFYLLGTETALARLAPAVLGGVLAGLPYLYRWTLGRKAAIVLAFALALDPGLIALSRTASGAMMGVAFLLLALTAWLAGRPILAGALAALSLISGPAGYLGAAAMGLAILIGRAIHLTLPMSFESGKDGEIHRRAGAGRLSLISGAGTLLLAGTFFMVYPSGLGAIADVIPDFLVNLITAGGVPVARQAFSLLVYQPLVIIFGVWGAGRAWVKGDDLGRFLSLWFVFGLVIAVLPPGRQVWHLAWALIPLMALAASTIARELEWDAETGYVSLGLMGLILVLMTFIWFQLASLARFGEASQERFLLVVGVIFITIVAIALVSLGWSALAARRGLVWGLLIGLGIFSLSSTIHAVSPLASRAQELWYGQPSVVHDGLMLDTLSDISEWSTGERTSMDVIVSEDRPSLRWALRQFESANFTPQIDRGMMPSAMITSIFDQPLQPAAYRGSDYLWTSAPAWEGGAPPEILRWIFFRESPTQDVSVILWGRNDLYPGGALNPEEGLPLPLPAEEVP